MCPCTPVATIGSLTWLYSGPFIRLCKSHGPPLIVQYPRVYLVDEGKVDSHIWSDLLTIVPISHSLTHTLINLKYQHSLSYTNASTLSATSTLTPSLNSGCTHSSTNSFTYTQSLIHSLHTHSPSFIHLFIHYPIIGLCEPYSCTSTPHSLYPTIDQSWHQSPTYVL